MSDSSALEKEVRIVRCCSYRTFTQNDGARHEVVNLVCHLKALKLNLAIDRVSTIWPLNRASRTGKRAGLS